jgi:hypothetical protein
LRRRRPGEQQLLVLPPWYPLGPHPVAGHRRDRRLAVLLSEWRDPYLCLVSVGLSRARWGKRKPKAKAIPGAPSCCSPDTDTNSQNKSALYSFFLSFFLSRRGGRKEKKRTNLQSAEEYYSTYCIIFLTVQCHPSIQRASFTHKEGIQP